MAWYTTECLYRADIGNGPTAELLFEYRYFLLKAENEVVAGKKALEVAKRGQHHYSNVEGKDVSWILEQVIGTKEILCEELLDGTEIYHRYVDRPFPDSE